jgi:hypothetical protein
MISDLGSGFMRCLLQLYSSALRMLIGSAGYWYGCAEHFGAMLHQVARSYKRFEP